ncbi:tail protein [Klebsiella phage 1513]|uniref:Tail fiber protein n=1 Tax=Klebsiella phage 1513 TaxID=1610829 RepID=A0A0C5ACP6_9CAUD|nr:tail protein [Klebsiella phage 1513]AJK28211.1 hypothetical protein PK_071 [Klebsiella phage 1513]
MLLSALLNQPKRAKCMALYREGKAAMSADGTVTGTGTKWQSSLSLIRPGATIMFLSSPIQMAVVNKVVSDTEIKAITTNGAVVASSDYAILLSDSLTVDGLAQDVAETLRYYQSQETVIADAVEFFKEFDFESLQNLANQIKADSEAAESSAAAAAASESKAKTSEVAAEAARDQVQQIINDAGEQSTLVVLAQPDGYMKIGNFFSGEGPESVGDVNLSVWERIFKRGEFEIHQMPGDPAGVAGIVFGGPNNKAALVLDERGRIQTYAIVDGKLSAAQVGTPIVQGTGYFRNGFEDRIIRFPSAGGESDDLTPGILITTNDNGICDFFVVSPNQFNDLGYPTGSSIDKQMFKLVKSFDIGTSLQRTIDQCPTVENSSPVLYRLFDVNYSGYGSKVVSGILSVGNYVNYTPNVYMVTFNPQALGNSPVIDHGSIYQWLKVTALHGGQSGWGDSALTPAVGLVNDPNNSVAKLFLRLPSYGQKISFTPINVADPNVVTFYYNDLRNNVTVDTPNYLVYSFAEKMVTDRFYVKMNNGDVRYSPGVVVRVSGNVTDRLSEKLSDGVFAIGGSYHLANKGNASRITVTNPSIGQYVISGCNLRGDHWKVCPPVGFLGTSFGTPQYVVNIVSQGTNTFTIEVTTAAGSLVNINGSDWLDLHVQPA